MGKHFRPLPRCRIRRWWNSCVKAQNTSLTWLLERAGQTFVCLLREEHPLLAGGLSQQGYSCVQHIGLVGEGHGQRKFEERILKSGVARHIVFRSRHFMNIPFIVRDTDLIATVPKVIAVAFIGTPGLRAVAPPFAIPPIPIRQYWSER